MRWSEVRLREAQKPARVWASKNRDEVDSPNTGLAFLEFDDPNLAMNFMNYILGNREALLTKLGNKYKICFK